MPSHLNVILTALGVIFLARLGAPVLVPLTFAIFLSQMLVPLVKRLERVMPSPIAIAVAMLGVSAVITAAGAMISEQMTSLTGTSNSLLGRLDHVLATVQQALSERLHIDPSRQVALLRKSLDTAFGEGGKLAMTAVTSTISVVGAMALVAIIVYLLLLYRRHILRQLMDLVARENRRLAGEVLSRISDIGQSYVVGLVSVIAIVMVLDAVGLALVGSKYALLFGLLGGLAVAVPYVGIAIVAPICVAITWLSQENGWAPLSVLAVFAVVHFAEGNIISPSVTGKRVDLNPLAAILAVLIGSQIWGLAGMILSIPLTGVLKVVLDVIPDAQPFARLLGSITVEDRAPKKRAEVKAPAAVQRTV